MKILYIFLFLVLFSGCATDPINTDRFQDYVPWWYSGSANSNIVNNSTNALK